MQMHPVVYGRADSVYVQAVRLTLWAKAVRHELVEVDVFAPGGPPAEYLLRHPFGRIPSFEHGSVRLYETAPICRYIDEAFAGPELQPATAAARAVTGQVISIMDSYAYRSLVWGIYVERVSKPRRGLECDQATVAAARKQATICLGVLENIASSKWLATEGLSLADLHAAPMFALFMAAPDASELMAPNPRLAAWWQRISDHVSSAGIL